jgi:flagellar hook-length control protein FliK
VQHVASKISALQTQIAAQRQRTAESEAAASPFSNLLSNAEEATPPTRNRAARTNDSLAPRPLDETRPKRADDDCAAEGSEEPVLESTGTELPNNTATDRPDESVATQASEPTEPTADGQGNPAANALALINAPVPPLAPPPSTGEAVDPAPAVTAPISADSVPAAPVPTITEPAATAPLSTPPVEAAPNPGQASGAAGPSDNAPPQAAASTPTDARTAGTANKPPAGTIVHEQAQQLAEQVDLAPIQAADDPEPEAAADLPEGLATPQAKPQADIARPVTAPTATAASAANTADPHMAGSGVPNKLDTDAPRAAPAETPPSGPAAEAKPKETAERPQIGGAVSDFVQTAKPTPDSAHLTHMQTGREFGQAVAATAHAAQPVDPSRLMAAAPVAIETLAVDIATRAQAGNTRFEIRLDPPELGRIDVRLDIDRGGNVTSRLVVERAETLDALRRDAHQLERALQDAGLKTSDNALQFSLRDQAFADRNGNDGSDNPRGVIDDSDLITTEAIPVTYGLTLRDGSIDIRV